MLSLLGRNAIFIVTSFFIFTATLFCAGLGYSSSPAIANLHGDSFIYTEGDPATLIDQGGDATVTDTDSTDFNSGTLTVAITSGEDATEDVLNFDTSGTLTLAGTAAGSNISVGGSLVGTLGNNIAAGNDLVVMFTTVKATPENVQALISAITYQNSDTDAPTTGSRNIRTTINDGDGYTSANVDVTVTVADVNDDPAITSLPTDVTATEEILSDVNLSAATFSDADSEASAITLTIAAGAGTLIASSGGGVTVSGSGTGTLTLVGTAINIDTFLNTASNIQFIGALNVYGNNVTTLMLTANDGGATGSGGGGNVVLGTVNVDITGVADTPGVTSATTNEDTQTTSGLVISRNVNDGAEVTHFKITNITGGTLYKNDGVTPIANNDFITFAEGYAGLKFTPTTNSSSNGTFFVQAATDGVGGGLSAGSAQAVITVIPVNDPPTVTNLNGDAQTFAVGGYGLVLDANGDATLSDIDSPDFNGGNVTVVVVANSIHDEDVLMVGSVGNISTSGSNVIHSDGVTIGTFSGGAGGNNLVITLNANATVARTRDLLSALQYLDTDAGTLNTITRTIRITVDDGDGGNSTSSSQDVSVSLVRAPLIDLDVDDSSGAPYGGYYGSFTEGYGAVATADTDSAIVDDGMFKLLKVTLTSRPDGTSESLSSSIGTGSLTVNGEPVTISSYNSSTGDLMITIDDGSTTATTMQLLMESIRYNNTSEVPDTASRNINYTAVDNADNTGPASTAIITVTAVNDPPVFSGLDGTPSFVEGGAAVTLDGDVTIADLELDDADNYNDAVLTLVRHGVADPNDKFSETGSLSPLTESSFFNLGGANLGMVTANSGGTLVLTFGDNATAASVDTVLQSINYNNASDAPVSSVQIDWTFHDGNSGTQGTGGNLTATGSTIVSITAVNDVPVFTGTPTISGVSRVGKTLSLVDIGQYDADGDPVVLSYQWAADGIEIPGATFNTYEPTKDDEHKSITCSITMDDGNGGIETFTTTGVVVKSSFPWPIFLPAATNNEQP